MTTITMYKCDTCGQMYDSEEKALKCENGHAVLLELEEVDYRPGEAFPRRIYVKTSNGKTGYYEFGGVCFAQHAEKQEEIAK